MQVSATEKQTQTVRVLRQQVAPGAEEPPELVRAEASLKVRPHCMWRGWYSGRVVGIARSMGACVRAKRAHVRMWGSSPSVQGCTEVRGGPCQELRMRACVCV